MKRVPPGVGLRVLWYVADTLLLPEVTGYTASLLLLLRIYPFLPVVLYIRLSYVQILPFFGYFLAKQTIGAAERRGPLVLVHHEDKLQPGAQAEALCIGSVISPVV